MTNVTMFKGSKEAPKSQRSSMETLLLSVEEINQWRLPSCQRPLRVNAKLVSIAADMKANGVEITGVITLGKIGRDPAIYIVDGQHRLEAFRLSGMPEIIADVRIVHFDNEAELSAEFVRLNSDIVRMRPDDIMRGLESSCHAVRTLRETCNFVGFDQIRRRGTSGPLVSMSTVIRNWRGSIPETPVPGLAGSSIRQVAMEMDADTTSQLCQFLLMAHTAWGRDPEYYRLWGNLNLTLCMWLYRRVVLDRQRAGNKRTVVLTQSQFRQCLTALSSDNHYLDWLVNRALNDRARSPCYGRIKAIFTARLREELHDGKKIMLPQPAWST